VKTASTVYHTHTFGSMPPDPVLLNASFNRDRRARGSVSGSFDLVRPTPRGTAATAPYKFRRAPDAGFWAAPP
jgi:hypothetical protein